MDEKQARNDNINEFPWNLSTFGKPWPQELPVEHTEWHKINKMTENIN